MKKKVCKRCKFFVDEGDCPICKGANFSASWQGRVFIINSEKSMVAEKVGYKDNGEYAIKVR